MIAYCVRSGSPGGKCGLGIERKEQVMCCSKDGKGGKKSKVWESAEGEEVGSGRKMCSFLEKKCV